MLNLLEALLIQPNRGDNPFFVGRIVS